MILPTVARDYFAGHGYTGYPADAPFAPEPDRGLPDRRGTDRPIRLRRDSGERHHRGVAELGVVFLLFDIGLHFSLAHLWEARRVRDKHHAARTCPLFCQPGGNGRAH